MNYAAAVKRIAQWRLVSWPTAASSISWRELISSVERKSSTPPGGLPRPSSTSCPTAIIPSAECWRRNNRCSFRTSRPISYAPFTKDEEHRRLLEAIGIESVMLVPVVAHDRFVAVLSTVWCRPGRRYRPEDVGVTQECARRARLLQVVENLIGNAIKFTDPGRCVVVGARSRDRDVHFWVRDSGSGIAEEDVRHLFDRFWQPTTRGVVAPVSDYPSSRELSKRIAVESGSRARKGRPYFLLHDPHGRPRHSGITVIGIRLILGGIVVIGPRVMSRRYDLRVFHGPYSDDWR